MNFDDFSTGYLMSLVLISCIGGAFALYGKKNQRLFPLLGGIALGIFPFLVSNLYAMWAIAIAIMVVLYYLRDN